MSIVFEWKRAEMESLLATCETDGVFPLIVKHIPRGSSVLESGCGAGRWLRYLQDRGWHVIGLEFSGETVEMVRNVWPDLNILQGDAANSPFSEGQFDGVLSLGVVEHWSEGPNVPLQDIYRVLRPQGIAIITVPCQNGVRQLKRILWWTEMSAALRALAGRVIKGRRKRLIPNRLKRGYKYAVYPAYGEFFEYRMTTEEFAKEVRQAGFEVVEHLPHGVIDGLYHELNPLRLLVKFRHWKFFVSPIGRRLNELLAKRPFLHCHMQLIVARKP